MSRHTYTSVAVTYNTNVYAQISTPNIQFVLVTGIWRQRFSSTIFFVLEYVLLSAKDVTPIGSLRSDILKIIKYAKQISKINHRRNHNKSLLNNVSKKFSYVFKMYVIFFYITYRDITFMIIKLKAWSIISNAHNLPI